MYRAITYFNHAGVPSEALRLESESLHTLQEAEQVLEDLKEGLGTTMTGGHIEVLVPNIGWVITDEAHVVTETAIIGNARRFLEDTGCP